LHLADDVHDDDRASVELDHVDPRHDHHDDQHHHDHLEHDDNVGAACRVDRPANNCPSTCTDPVGGMTELEVRHILALALHHYHSPVYDSRCPVDG
jgi:hypothetical protein